MKKLPLLTFTILALIFSLTAFGQAQSKPRGATAKVSPAVEPAIDIDSLLAKDSYVIYAEIRMPGRIAASTQVSEFFEAMKTLDAMPQEATRLRDFVLKHAEELDASRIVIAGLPARPGIPTGLTAIQFESPEAAAKMQPILAEYALDTAGSLMGRLIGPAKDQGKSAAGASASVEARLAALGVNIKRSGALICMADQKIDFAALRPARSKPMSADPNFQASRSRFAVEPLFVYYNVRAQDRFEQERIKKWREEQETEKARAAKEAAQPKPNEPEAQIVEGEAKLVPAEPGGETVTTTTTIMADEPVVVPAEAMPSPEASPTPAPTPNPSARAFSRLMDSIFSAASTWPDAVAAAASFEGDDLGLKMMLVDHSGKKIGPVPFFSAITTGRPISTGASALAPDNADIFVSMSLDLPATLDAALAAPQRPNRRYEPEPVKTGGSTETEESNDSVSPQKQIAILETLLGFKIKEEFLAAFGDEVAIAVDVDPPASEQKPGARRGNPQPAVAIFFSLNDKAAAQRMLPKVLQLIGAGGAPSTEQYKDVEISSYGQVAVAFVDDFAVFAPEVEHLKRVIEKRASGQSLASTQGYRNAVYWQPPQRLGQAYVASHLIESTFTEGSIILDYAGDQGREFIARFRPEPRPVTWSLSNDGTGYLYDLHIPNSSLLRWSAEMAMAWRFSEILSNEANAKMALTSLAGFEESYKSSIGNGSYGSLQDLTKDDELPKHITENKAYKLDVILTSDGFEATATPVEYGEKARRSFFIDATHIMRGGDFGGRRATATDPEVKR